MSYIQQQKYKHSDVKNIDKDKWMLLALNKYKNMCTEEKWLAKSPEEQQIVAIYEELEKMKDTNLKYVNAIKAKVTPKVKTTMQVNQKWDKKKC